MNLIAYSNAIHAPRRRRVLRPWVWALLATFVVFGSGYIVGATVSHAQALAREVQP